MSGIVAMLRLDGRAVDAVAFDALVAQLAIRREGSARTFVDGVVALAGPSGGAIAFDGRLDADYRPPVEVIAETYARHEQLAPRHLLGDFAFVMWDAARQRLFAARDRFGIRPLYYAHIGGALIVTNTLPLLLDHPQRSTALNRDAIADFLLFGYNSDLRTTTHAAIQRVPPAHTFAATNDGAVTLTRYWSLPAPAEPRKIDERDAADELRELLTRAVRDRTRGGSVVVSLSGGVDSTTAAAMLMREPPARVSALTTVWQSRVADTEGRWSALAASSLGIPHELQVVDRYQPFERWDDRRARGLEPTDDPFSAILLDFTARAAELAPVALTGQGGDVVFYTSHSYFFDLLRRGRWIRFVYDALHYALTRRRRPPLLIRSQLRVARGRAAWKPPFPEWLNPDFARETAARERFEAMFAPPPARIHAFRNEAARLAMRPIWSNIFEAYDAGATGNPVVFTTPYFDVRVVEFLFSLPPMPHFAGKDLARRTTAGLLPDALRFRPKTPLAGDVVRDTFRAETQRWIDFLHASPEIEPYVDRRILAEAIRSGTTDGYRTYQQVIGLSLAAWLRGAAP